MDFLTKITAEKQREVAALKKGRVDVLALIAATTGPFIIAEIKPKSPSAGQLYASDPIALAKQYEDAGANMISVLTDQKHFGGSIDLLKQIRTAVTIPILRKEFIIDESQILEAYDAGANAILLIVSLVDQTKLAALIRFAQQLGLCPCVEIFSTDEIAKAVAAKAPVIGVNARNLRTMEMNNDQAIAVLKKVPKQIPTLLFSGVENAADVSKAQQAGACGVLVGTALLKADDVTAKLKELKHAYE